MNSFQESSHRAMSDAEILLALSGAWTLAIDGFGPKEKFRGTSWFGQVAAIARERPGGEALIAEAKHQAEAGVKEREARNTPAARRARA